MLWLSASTCWSFRKFCDSLGTSRTFATHLIKNNAGILWLGLIEINADFFKKVGLTWAKNCWISRIVVAHLLKDNAEISRNFVGLTWSKWCWILAILWLTRAKPKLRVLEILLFFVTHLIRNAGTYVIFVATHLFKVFEFLGLSVTHLLRFTWSKYCGYKQDRNL